MIQQVVLVYIYFGRTATAEGDTKREVGRDEWKGNRRS